MTRPIRNGTMMACLGELANVAMSATRLGTYASRLTHTEFQIQG
jgi:hypothetical protein